MMQGSYYSFQLSSYVFGPRGVEMPHLGMLLDKNTYLALILRQVPMSFVKMELGQFFFNL